MAMDVILMADHVSLACDVSYLALLGMELHEPVSFQLL
jgi:hypothetical protein